MSNSYDEITGDLSKKGKGRRTRLMNIGHGNFVVRDRIVAVISTSSLPMKHFREKAHEKDLLVDATKGKKTKSLIITDSKYIFLSSLSQQALHDRLESGEPLPTLSQIEMEDGEFVS